MKKILIVLLIAFVSVSAVFAETDWFAGGGVKVDIKDSNMLLGPGLFYSTTSKPITSGSFIYYTTGGFAIPLVYNLYNDGFEFLSLDYFELDFYSNVVAGFEGQLSENVRLRGGLGLDNTSEFASYLSLVAIEDILGICADAELNATIGKNAFVVLDVNLVAPALIISFVGASDSSASYTDFSFVDSLDVKANCRLGLGFRF